MKNTGKMKTAVLADMKTCFDKNDFWVDCFKMGTVAYGDTLAGHGHCTWNTHIFALFEILAEMKWETTGLSQILWQHAYEVPDSSCHSLKYLGHSVHT